ncbi:MAG: DUF2313 domain-containing protein [Oscillospiraceae bacterium]|jgi:hypothetical protein|nr:DUF2313 domain-containing protein [Oscillospiraceae bacterium]
MNVLDAMIKKLTPLEIYSFDNTTVKKELEVYAQELQNIQDDFDEMLGEAFIQTAKLYGLAEREKIYSKSSTELPLQTRRTMLMKRFAVNEKGAAPSSILDFATSLGATVTVSEYIPYTLVIVDVVDSVFTNERQEFIREQMLGIIPAHLLVEIYFNGTKWSEFNSQNSTWAQLNGQNKSWFVINGN